MTTLRLTSAQRRELERIARANSLPYRQVVAARCVLRASDGLQLRHIAREVGTTPTSVRRWIERYASAGLPGLGTVATGRGRKRTVRDRVAEAIVRDTLKGPPPELERWTLRDMAKRHGVSKDTVARVWREHGVRPPAGPQGKTPEARLEAGVLPGADVNGVLTALDVATGQALSRCRPNEVHRDFLFFVKLIEAIEMWVAHWDDPSRPFAWQSREEVVENTARAKAALASYRKLATGGGSHSE